MMNKTHKTDRAYLTVNDIFESYQGPLDKNTYKLIICTFNYLLTKHMMDEGKVYYVPGNLGVMGIFKMPVVGRGVFDYKLYKEEGVKYWRKNLHSSSYAARFLWIKKFPRCLLPSILLPAYKWKAPRDLKRLLAKKIKHNNAINRYYDKNEY